MTPLLHPFLVNDRFGDPALYVDFKFARRAMLFDLGDLSGLEPRKMLRIRDVFVSHTHIDHFIGFDSLLRTLIGRERVVGLYGPPGFIDQVGHRLAAYAWNLVERYAADLAFSVTEVHAADRARRARFRFKSRFRREADQDIALADGVLCEDEGFRVRAALLDHRTPCLGFAIEESLHVNVWKNRLDALGLPVGPWLNEAKRAVREGAPDDTELAVPGRARAMTLGRLRSEALSVVPGQKIGYVVDVAYTPENVRRIVDLVRGADIFFIEAPFAREDTARAADRAHLTTAQAGAIARQAGASRIEPFHFSPRYAGEGERLRREVAEAFAAAPGAVPAG